MTAARAVAVGVSGLALVALAAPASALPPGRLSAPAQAGTVDTVAGPRFCDGPAAPDPASTAVGAVAASADGRLWFQSGAVPGVLTKVVSSVEVGVVRTQLVPEDAPGDPARSPLASATLASDGDGGVLIALPAAVAQFDSVPAAVAGSEAVPGGEPGGDGGPLAAARFRRVVAIVSDQAGNVYVADEVDPAAPAVAIRFLNRGDHPVTFYTGTSREVVVGPGTVATIAGGAGGPPVVAGAVVLAVAGERLYIGGTAPGAVGAAVQMINLGGGDVTAHAKTVPPGGIAEVATVTAQERTPVVGSAATSPLSAIAADSQGSLFLAEGANHRVRRMDPAGSVTTFAGTGSPGFDGNDRPAAQARLNRPVDVDVAGERVYISDAGNGQVRFVDQAGVVRPTLGNGAVAHWTCAGPPPGPVAAVTPTARRGEPMSVVADGAGGAYLSALEHVYQLLPAGRLQPLAGRPQGSCPPQGCQIPEEAPPAEAHFIEIVAVARGPAGGAYVVEDLRVRFLNSTSRPVTVHGVAVPAGGFRTVAGLPVGVRQRVAVSVPQPPVDAATPTTVFSTAPPATVPDGAPAVATETGVYYLAAAADQRGNLIVADLPLGPFFTGNGSVRQIDPAGKVTTLVDRPGVRADASPDPARCCASPSGLAIDPAGSLYIADSVGGRVWFLNRGPAPVVVHGVPVTPGALEAVAGAVEAGSIDDGVPALDADLTRPAALALDRSGNLYVADTREHTVRRIDSRGVITTVAGTGQPGFNGDGLKGQVTAFDRPRAIAIDACGNLLIADTGNDRVRRLNLTTSCGDLDAAAGDGGWRLTPVVAAGAGAAVVVALGVSAFVARNRGRRPGTPAPVGAGED